MLALLGKLPPGNYQQFIDKGVNEKFVYLCQGASLERVIEVSLD
jgi:hypothetical protein